MKKMFVSVTAICLMSFFAFGCPTTTPDTTDPSQPQGRSLGQADTETVIRDSLKELGYTVNVTVQDFDENGTEDIGIEYISGNESEKIFIFLAHITGVVGSIQQYFGWNSDKVILLIGNNLYVANISDCRHCSDMVNQNVSDEAIGECLLDTWWVIEGDESAEDKKKQLDKDQIL